MLFCLIKITWKPLSVLSSLSGYRGVPTQRVFFFPVCPSVSHFALTRAGGSIHMEGFFRSHHLFPLLTMGVIYFLPLGILYPIWHGVSNLAFAGGGGFHACMEASFPSHNIFPFSSSLSLGVPTHGRLLSRWHFLTSFAREGCHTYGSLTIYFLFSSP